MTETIKPAPIAGYRPLEPRQVDLANNIKVIEEALLRLVDLHLKDKTHFDARWAAIAKTHFQEGFMAINRANFQPTRIDGIIDAAEAFDRATLNLTPQSRYSDPEVTGLVMI